MTEHTPPRHHLLIAGTGRAGTSFLVRWLAAMGLETHLAAHPTPDWNEDANAGLEDLPIVSDRVAAPYVMKSPWLVELIDQVLADPGLVLDGVIIPMRDLEEAAVSRIVQERQDGYRRFPRLVELDRGFQQWGVTPGGVVFSLDPVDQARLLAVSFHHLVQRLVRAEIPIVLLDFPRLATDPDYLFGALRRFLPASADLPQARVVHASLADPTKIRAGSELAAAQSSNDQLDGAALRREVTRLSGALATAEAAARATREEGAAQHEQLQAREQELAAVRAMLEQAQAEIAKLQAARPDARRRPGRWAGRWFR